MMLQSLKEQMGKKDKKSNSITSKQIANRDNFARLSYLYQLSNQFITSPKTSSATTAPNDDSTLQTLLARGYDRNLDLLSKRTLSKISPSVKRSMCKKCHMLLIPGMTVSVRIENNSKTQDAKNDILVNKCLTCGECKRFPIGKDREYIPFFERGYVDEKQSQS